MRGVDGMGSGCEMYVVLDGLTEDGEANESDGESWDGVPEEVMMGEVIEDESGCVWSVCVDGVRECSDDGDGDVCVCAPFAEEMMVDDVGESADTGRVWSV